MNLYTIKYKYQITEDSLLIESSINFIDNEQVDLVNLLTYLNSLFSPDNVFNLEITGIIKSDEKI